MDDSGSNPTSALKESYMKRKRAVSGEIDQKNLQLCQLCNEKFDTKILKRHLKTWGDKIGNNTNLNQTQGSIDAKFGGTRERRYKL